MSTTLERSPVATPSDLESPLYRFTADDFERMIEGDIFPHDARVELWDGRIYQKMAEIQSHAVAAIKLSMTLFRALPPGWLLSHENPVIVGQASVPSPDLVALRGRPEDYNHRRPAPADIGLIVEVAVTSLKSDLGPRLAAYAEAGIPACWVISPVDGAIHAHRDPIPAERRYDTVAAVGRDGSIPLILDGVEVARIAASDILPIA